MENATELGFLALNSDRSDYQIFMDDICSICHKTMIPFQDTPSLNNAFRISKQRNCLLLVYLHSPKNPECQEFVKTYLASEELQDYLASTSKYIIWGANVTCNSGYEAMYNLAAFSIPFIAIINSEQSSMPILKRITFDTIDHNIFSFISMLEILYSTVEADLNQARTRQEQVKNSQMLRRQQDDAYQRSLAIDRAKKQERERLEQQERIKNEHIQTSRENKKIEIERAIKIWNDQSSKYQDGIGMLSFRWPEGYRTRHSFSLDHVTLLGLYGFIYQNIDKDIPLNMNILLSTNFPKVCYPLEREKKDMTLHSLGISSNNVIYVEFLSKDDDNFE